MSKKKLTLKQQKFADEYIITGNIEKAAIKAGYSKSYARGNAHKLVANVSIKEYINERLEEIKTEKVADQQEVMEYLTAVMRGETQDEMLMIVGDEIGTEVERHEKRSDTVARTKAAELLGKRYMLWTNKVQHEGNIELVFEDDYGDEEES
ncbi:terminase small subunit [Ornithinibacillus xuwenensis]|uniref:Terminase small subunit n=1 Tax=Ornithinibacillus xuwenensis TaxID=3144668 RepID=A0ABU9XC48_9BACI